MLWSQYPNLKYKPDPVIYLQLDQLNAFRKHFDAQVFSYKKQVVINLVRLLLFVMFCYSLSSPMCILLLNFQCDQKGQEIGLVNNFNRFIRDMNHKDVRWRTFYVSLIFVFLYSSFIDIFRYVPFDFHHECRKMRWDRLSVLLDQINADQAEFR